MFKVVKFKFVLFTIENCEEMLLLISNYWNNTIYIVSKKKCLYIYWYYSVAKTSALPPNYNHW